MLNSEKRTQASQRVDARACRNFAADSEWLTTKEVAARLKVHPETLVKWRRKGTGPRFERAGSRCIRYWPGEVEAFMRGLPKAGH
jgi:predicted DNA-binding transcriptional regulator AlpA